MNGATTALRYGGFRPVSLAAPNRILSRLKVDREAEVNQQQALRAGLGVFAT